MARLTKSQWEELKADYEINGLSYSELSLKYSVGKTTVADKVKKESWVKGFTEQLISRKLKAIKELNDITEQTEQLSVRNKEEFGKRFDYKLRMEEELEESGFLAARANNLVARDLVSTMEHPDYIPEESPVKTIESVASTYQKLRKSEPATVVNQTTNVMNVSLDERKQELMNLIKVYD